MALFKRNVALQLWTEKIIEEIVVLYLSLYISVPHSSAKKAISFSKSIREEWSAMELFMKDRGMELSSRVSTS
jgi:hypothetical protein